MKTLSYGKYPCFSVQSERLERLQLEVQNQEHKLEDTDSVKRKLAVSCYAWLCEHRFLAVSCVVLHAYKHSPARFQNWGQFLSFSVGAEGAECVAIRDQSVAPGGGQQPPQQAGKAL